MSRVRTLKVAHVEHVLEMQGPGYKVLVIKNSVDYAPGQILTRTEVDELCKNGSWDVTVVPHVTGDAS